MNFNLHTETPSNDEVRICLAKVKLRLKTLEAELKDYYNKLGTDSIKLEPIIHGIHVLEEEEVHFAITLCAHLCPDGFLKVVTSHFCFREDLSDMTLMDVTKQINETVHKELATYRRMLDAYPAGLGE